MQNWPFHFTLVCEWGEELTAPRESWPILKPTPAGRASTCTHVHGTCQHLPRWQRHEIERKELAAYRTPSQRFRLYPACWGARFSESSPRLLLNTEWVFLCACCFFKRTVLKINEEKCPPFQAIVIWDFSVTWGSPQKRVIPPALFRKTCAVQRGAGSHPARGPRFGCCRRAGRFQRKEPPRRPTASPALPQLHRPFALGTAYVSSTVCRMVIEWHQPPPGRLLIILQTSRKVWGVRGSWERCWNGCAWLRAETQVRFSLG